jgi:DNA-binding NarL/FixJ family response regulator
MCPVSLVLIEDHPIFREGLRRVLEAHSDLEVVGEAETLAAALEQVCVLRPDVALLDLGLKDGSGLDALPDLLEESPQTRVIVLTGQGVENSLPALRLGARGFVSKDTASSDVVRAIRAVLRGEIWAERRVEGQLVDTLFARQAPRGAEENLTPREQEVLRLVGEGKRNPQIARDLSISENTVKTHISSLMRKLSIDDRVQLALHANRAPRAAR